MYKHEMEELKNLQKKKGLTKEESSKNISLIFRLATHREDVAINENIKEESNG
jgi:hypothetical protein